MTENEKISNTIDVLVGDCNGVDILCGDFVDMGSMHQQL